MNKLTHKDYDVIVVGGGHAGIEAAYAAARMGSRTLLVTLAKDKIGLMPCNPSLGGIGKGHIVFEVSALGGLMPQLATHTYLQARMLNTSRGPAVHGLRLQIDKHAYSKRSQEILANVKNLTILEAKVIDLIKEKDTVAGVITVAGEKVTAHSVILTTGTFLNGLIHQGTVNFPAGRQDEDAVYGLTDVLARSCNLEIIRLKTGTPPRLYRDTVDFSKLELQEAEPLTSLFEFYPHATTTKRDCYIARTNENTHEIIRKNLHLSAMYNDSIKGRGPRYCPSIEDKISRFPDKTSHQVFVEPESEHCNEVYPSGLSTSLPLEIQKLYINSIEGFENAIIARAGYAVEYDAVLPHQLHETLEARTSPGLFLAGQINGTTGYEEAAGQGIIAGINAHLRATDQPPFILSRQESYIGVMINDLITLGVDEPYRMFTSRAERRLLLRQDNAFHRLGHKAYALGLLDNTLYQDILEEQKLIDTALALLNNNKQCTELLHTLDDNDACKKKIAELLTADLSIGDDKTHKVQELTDRTLNTIVAHIRYEPYLKREQKEVEKALIYQDLPLAPTLDYRSMQGLSKELREKLVKHKPTTIAQATLIPGMTPAAISLLIFRSRQELTSANSSLLPSSTQGSTECDGSHC